LQLRKALHYLGTAAINNNDGHERGRSRSCPFPPILEPSLSVPSWQPSLRLRGSPRSSSSAHSRNQTQRPRCALHVPRRVPRRRPGQTTCGSSPPTIPSMCR
jgi:hypothetical protein